VVRIAASLISNAPLIGNAARAFGAVLWFAAAFILLASANFGDVNYISPAQCQPDIRTKPQSVALSAYNDALDAFKSLLKERRAQIDSNQLPKIPGRALHVARNNMISAYKDLTDVMPSKSGRSNKFGFPPTYLDADNEGLLDEYESLVEIMERPSSNAQSSSTPFKDVIDLGVEIARAKGLDAPNAQMAGRISLGIFFAETSGRQNAGNARSDTYIGSFQTGPAEDQNGQRKWKSIRKSIIAFDPALIARDTEEEARVDNFDHRLNHWTAVRDGLMNAPSDFFQQIPAIAKTFPNPIDQMKVFELIQIIPSPTRSALSSVDVAHYKIAESRIIGYLRDNSIFSFGKRDRERTSATFREIIDAMWLFEYNLGRALATFEEFKDDQGNLNDKP
jgi:hypothetical protein